MKSPKYYLLVLVSLLLLCQPLKVVAGGVDPLLGSISIFAGNFAPRGWALCQGQLLPISQNTALFSILGTTYGGDGRTTFGLPDLRGRLPVHAGHGPGLTTRTLGSKFGSESVTLTSATIPSHDHAVWANSGAGDSASPAGRYWSHSEAGDESFTDQAADVNLASNAVSFVGSGQAHENLPPFLVVNYIIATNGIFPSRN